MCGGLECRASSIAVPVSPHHPDVSCVTAMRASRSAWPPHPPQRGHRDRKPISNMNLRMGRPVAALGRPVTGCDRIGPHGLQSPVGPVSGHAVAFVARTAASRAASIPCAPSSLLTCQRTAPP